MLQAPDKFAAAAVRNPVCNLALMVGTTDIPDWAYFETYGSLGKNSFTEAPSAEDLIALYKKSPISHLSKELKERGGNVKTIMFPDDIHEIDRSRLPKLKY
ncbi:hypothetical protein L484_010282 [Morus notabilis]|uniref:Uncharacterized protein n=1 Tax=Morus notabilis TaxID=981085 RepID=W9R9M5_9ROSA|nr:hypothetical protein L484_010282 [Morus notabilis]